MMTYYNVSNKYIKKYIKRYKKYIFKVYILLLIPLFLKLLDCIGSLEHD